MRYAADTLQALQDRLAAQADLILHIALPSDVAHRVDFAVAFTAHRTSLCATGADAAVVRRTMAARSAAGLPATHYLAFFTIASRLRLWLFLALGALLATLARFPLGRRFLLTAPAAATAGTFTHEGPTQAQMEGTSFLMTHEGFLVDTASGVPAREPAV